MKNYNEERRKDPVKISRDQATKNRYSLTSRGKNSVHKCMRKRLEREKGCMPVNIPHITTLAI